MQIQQEVFGNFSCKFIPPIGENTNVREVFLPNKKINHHQNRLKKNGPKVHLRTNLTKEEAVATCYCHAPN